MNLPNIITLGRLFLVPFFFTELLSFKDGQEIHRWAALAIFSIAAASDALDGMIARLTNTQTELGRFLDPLADKFLLFSGIIGLLWVHTLPYRPPLWFTVAVVFRDLVIILGLIVLYLMTGKVQVRPNFLGKLTTAGQMATLIAVLLEFPFSSILWNLTGALTIASLLVYLNRELSGLGTLK